MYAVKPYQNSYQRPMEAVGYSVVPTPANSGMKGLTFDGTGFLGTGLFASGLDVTGWGFSEWGIVAGLGYVAYRMVFSSGSRSLAGRRRQLRLAKAQYDLKRASVEL